MKTTAAFRERIVTVGEIAAVLGLSGTVADAADRRLTGITADSRQVQPGNLFVCLAGERFDGHDFLPAAAAAGATAAIVAAGRQAALARLAPALTLLPVADPLAALGDLAAWWLREMGPRVIAVTGSNGKTTTREMIAELLACRWRVHRNPGNFNNLIGVPWTIFTLRSDHQRLVLELGMNRPGEIARLATICRPAGVVLTNLAAAHLEGLGDLNGVAAAKAEIFTGLDEDGYVVYNADDRRLAAMVTAAAAGRSWTLLPVSLDADAPVPVRARQLRLGAAGSSFRLEIDGVAAPATLEIPGRHQVGNALLAAAVAWQEGLAVGEIAAAVSRLTALPGRFRVWELPAGGLLIDDTYNANPGSMRASLDALEEMGRGRPRAAVLGDMFELGAAAAALHREVGEYAGRRGLDLLLAYGPLAAELAAAAVAAGMPAALVHHFQPGEEEAVCARLTALLPANGVVLVKGSRGMAMEKIVHRLLAAEEVEA
ncbi:MAG: UDP-N-acetylmuramoyl-tripeptide--D-alanyl-D-alanine ligase [Deltaproteobacteria bacterium]|nr:UDP-N-acetylmuramoyl-tripeptide--D-alanyl-D-alanine ligase [Deltaproteobacteria bacterium]